MTQATLSQADTTKRLQVFISTEAYRRISVAAAANDTGKAEVIEALAIKHLPPVSSEEPDVA